MIQLLLFALLTPFFNGLSVTVKGKEYGVMAHDVPEVIDKYEVLFSSRTGITILFPKTPVFDCGVEIPVSFHISTKDARDLVIIAAERRLILKNLKKDYLDEALTRRFIMFYEVEEDEVIRCTPCSFSSGH